MYKLRILLLTVAAQSLGHVEGQAHANILELSVFGDPNFFRSYCWPGYVKDAKFLSAPIPVISCNATFFGSLPCDSMLSWTFVAIDKNGIEIPIGEDTDTLKNCMEKSRGSILFTLADSIRKCINRTAICPLTGEFEIDKCRMLLGISKLPISKTWKVKAWFTVDEKVVFGFALKFEVDDTDLMRAKRPTAGQRNRRKQKQNHLLLQ